MDDKWLNILQKLMAKAEDSATTMDERNAIVEKMTFLMAKHGIEQAMLNAEQDKPEAVISVRFTLNNPYLNPKITLLYGIVKTFGAHGIMAEMSQRKPGRYRGLQPAPDAKTVMQIYGYSSDIEKILMLNGSLNIQMSTALAGAIKPVHMHGKTFNSSFVVGYVDTVVVRVASAYTKAKTDVSSSATGNGMELVLKTRTAAIMDAFKLDHPHVHRINTTSRATSATAYGAGQFAGRNANIGQTGLGGGRKAIE
jgi:hypothetical protein